MLFFLFCLVHVPWCFSIVLITVVSVCLMNSVSSVPFLLAVWLQLPLVTATFAFRSPMMTMWLSCCSWLACVVSSSNWASIASLVVVSCLPYTTAIAILVLVFSLIQRISIALFSIVSITSTLCLMSFLIRKPTPPPLLCCLFFPIHWYPVIVTSLLPIRCVSVIAAIWVLWECSADVRLDILLVIPLVLSGVYRLTRIRLNVCYYHWGMQKCPLFNLMV